MILLFLPILLLGHSVKTECEDTKYRTIKCFAQREIPTNFTLRQCSAEEVHTFDLSVDNYVGSLRNGSFTKLSLKALKILNMSFTGLSRLERGAFSGIGTLTHLCLNNNQISFLDPFVFEGLLRLSFLDLSNNMIKEFAEDAQFPRLMELATLELSSSELTYIPENIFDKLTGKPHMRLSLRKNKIRKLGWRVFKNLFQIRVDLSENAFECDCHTKFLSWQFEENGITVDNRFIKCANGNTSWRDLDMAALSCEPVLTNLSYISYSVPSLTELECANSITFSTDQPIYVHQEIYFECSFYAHPKPAVTWEKDEMPIVLDPLSRKYIEISGPNEPVVGELEYTFRETLRIWDASPQDSGQYACVLTSGEPKTRHSISLTKNIRVLSQCVEMETDSDDYWKKIVCLIIGMLLCVSLCALAEYLLVEWEEVEKCCRGWCDYLLQTTPVTPVCAENDLEQSKVSRPEETSSDDTEKADTDTEASCTSPQPPKIPAPWQNTTRCKLPEKYRLYGIGCPANSCPSPSSSKVPPAYASFRNTAGVVTQCVNNECGACVESKEYCGATSDRNITADYFAMRGETSKSQSIKFMELTSVSVYDACESLSEEEKCEPAAELVPLPPEMPLFTEYE